MHRKLTLSDSGLKMAKSIDGGMDSIEGSTSEDKSGQVGKEEVDRRASTGEMSFPAMLTPVSPLPHIKDEGSILACVVSTRFIYIDKLIAGE